MDKNDYIEKCLSQEDKVDDEIDLDLITKAYKDDVMSQEEDSTSKLDDNDIIVCDIKSPNIQTNQSVDISKKNIEQSNNSKVVKSNRAYNRRSNPRYKSNKKQFFTTKRKNNNADTVDRWQHDKYDMLYGDSIPVNMEATQSDQVDGSNVEEIKDCIVSKLQSLTLTNSKINKKLKNPQSTTISKSTNSTNNMKINKDSNHNKNQKPTIPIVISDNTKKNFDKRYSSSPPLASIHVPLSELAKNQISNIPPNNISPIVNPKKPTHLSTHQSIISSSLTNDPPNQRNEFAYQKPVRDRTTGIPYHPRFNPKKYFGSTSFKNNPRHNIPSRSHDNSNPNENPIIPVDQSHQSYNDPTYFMDQNYYYYQTPYYHDMSSIQYQQPNVYLPTLYSSNVYYNDNVSSSSTYAYYDQPMYSEGFYYQPIEAYYPFESQPYEGYRSHHWTGGNYSKHYTRRY